MKKVLVLLLVFVSLVSAASAEGFNLSAMTTEELVSLRDAANAELAVRNFQTKEVVVPTGEYTIGVDIPAGVYTLINSENRTSLISTYETDGSLDLTFNVSQEKSVGKLELIDGQKIEIIFDSIVFKPYEGLGF